MSTLQQVQEGLSKAWDSLTEGWRELRDLAGDALTRFQPKVSGGELETAQEHNGARSSRWGLLAAEVSDEGDDIRVTLEAPGLEPDDFDIEIVGDLLVVRGEKKVLREESRGHYHVTERAYGQFERAIRLPAHVDDAGANARYRRGVLTVRLPKSHSARSRRISVESN